jgi:rhamnose utilization protein RhaD (predicted bifunctional aldolase and dehydrogenase)
VGTNPALVGVGGGNTSVKTEDGRHMYIKASGIHIGEVTEGSGWRRLDLKAVRSILTDSWVAELPENRRQAAIVARLAVACEDQFTEGGRPSTETHFHALLGRCVAHVHPPAGLAYVCARQGRSAVERLFREEEPPQLWVPYTNPGYALAKRMATLIRQYEKEHGGPPQVLFLENHGLLVSADRPEVLLKELRRVVRALARELTSGPSIWPKEPKKEAVRKAALAIRGAVGEATGERVCVRHLLDREVAGLLKSGDAKSLAGVPPVTPDEIVYALGSPLWVEKMARSALVRSLRRRVKTEGVPGAFLIEGLGLFGTGPPGSLDTVLDMACSALLVKWQAGRLGGARPLSKARRGFIAEWEAESYRRKLAEGAAGGELGGRIALVTGAGSGLGRSIALGLAKAGAVVALADIDAEAARAAAEMIVGGRASAAIAVPCDVTSETQVTAAVARVLDEWGGLDMLVNAAGIAPAHDLVDLPPKAWERTLAVNLTGYFLMGQAVARVLVEQELQRDEGGRDPYGAGVGAGAGAIRHPRQLGCAGERLPGFEDLGAGVHQGLRAEVWD